MDTLILIDVSRKYVLNLIPVIISSSFGLWLFMKGVRGDCSDFGHGFEIPQGIVILLALLMQIPLVVFLWIGYSTGMFRALIKGMH